LLQLELEFSSNCVSYIIQEGVMLQTEMEFFYNCVGDIQEGKYDAKEKNN